jgi:hypothetical protein
MSYLWDLKEVNLPNVEPEVAGKGSLIEVINS